MTTATVRKCQCGAPVVERDPRHMSEEQKWCGTWYECSRRGAFGEHSSTLIPSEELQKQLAEQEARLGAPKQGNLF